MKSMRGKKILQRGIGVNNPITPAGFLWFMRIGPKNSDRSSEREETGRNQVDMSKSVHGFGEQCYSPQPSRCFGVRGNAAEAQPG